MNFPIKLIPLIIAFFLISCDREQHSSNSEKLKVSQNNQRATVNKTSFSNIYTLIGSNFDSENFAKSLGAPQVFPTGDIIKEGQIRVYAGKRDLGVHAIAVTIQQNRIKIIDISIVEPSPVGQDLRKKLLQNFHKIGNQKVGLLDQKLQEKQFTFDEFALSENRLHALKLDDIEQTRVLFFDPEVTTVTEVLPSTRHLPKGLLDRARRVIEQERVKQREMR